MQAFTSRKAVDELSYKIIGAAIEVHKALGPGLLESVYQKCLYRELIERGIDSQSQLIVPITYRDLHFETELRCDLFVARTIVVEIKSAEAIAPIHEAQLLTYMRLLQAPKGILINFNCTNIFREGQRTLVNQYYASLEP